MLALASREKFTLLAGAEGFEPPIIWFWRESRLCLLMPVAARQKLFIYCGFLAGSIFMCHAESS